MLLYASLNLFLDRKWNVGSVIFSLAVGVKMNILLFAPAILMLYLTSLGFMKTILQLSICAVVQLVIGAPFLLTYPFSYIKGSFDLGRIFEHKWTVNYRFLDRALFENSTFHIGLLGLHLTLLTLVARPCYIFFQNYARLRKLQAQFEPQIAAENREIENLARKKMKKMKAKASDESGELTSDQKNFLKSFEKGLKNQFGEKSHPVEEVKEDDEEPKKVEIHFDQCVQLALLPIFLVNFIGIVCARSLHYQFYVWYFHSLPYLSWFTDYHTSFKILILFLIEFCWNQYPSTNFSSVLLHACHTILLSGVIYKIFKETRLARKVAKD
jgi:alpha-1,3-mannosyltransferase